MHVSPEGLYGESMESELTEIVVGIVIILIIEELVEVFLSMCSYASLSKKILILWPRSPLAKPSKTSIQSLHIHNQSVLPHSEPVRSATQLYPAGRVECEL